MGNFLREVMDDALLDPSDEIMAELLLLGELEIVDTEGFTMTLVHYRNKTYVTNMKKK